MLVLRKNDKNSHFGLILAQNGYFYHFLVFLRETNVLNMAFIGI